MPVLTLYATKCRTKTSLISQLGPSDTEECLRSMQAGKVNLTPLVMSEPPLACSRGGLLQPTVRWLPHSSAKAAWESLPAAQVTAALLLITRAGGLRK